MALGGTWWHLGPCSDTRATKLKHTLAFWCDTNHYKMIQLPMSHVLAEPSWHSLLQRRPAWQVTCETCARDACCTPARLQKHRYGVSNNVGNIYKIHALKA